MTAEAKREEHKTLETGVAGSCEMPRGRWELNQRPLEEQQVL